MNIKDLKYLVAIADHGHFGKAANACFVSQPALSMQIMKLEESLNVKLFERTNKSVLLTDYGTLIVEQARRILNQIEEVREIAKLAKDPFSGELKIGLFPSLAPYLLPLIIPALSKTYSKLSFYLIEEQTASLVEKLKQGKLDAALLAAPILEKNFNHALIFEEEFLLTMPAAHPFAKLKKIKQTHLDNKNLLLLEEGHCLREQALAVCHRMQATEMQGFRATSLETLRHMISAGIGMTLMPKLACHENNHIAYVPFTEPKPTRTIGMYWRANTCKQILLSKIVSEIKSILKKQKSVRIV
ncbi:MAG: LysR family transcriptional regulator [Gammaproteobacteria bacterium]|nr:LysR family transcriptional regulator [Gammaproteobacteria bacterium]